MSLLSWFLIFLLIQLVHFAGTWKLYRKAGRQAWEAAVPIYNAVVLMKIINRPWWWVILLFVPIVNLIMFPVVWVETLRSFGKNSTADTLLGVVTFGVYIYYVNYALDVQHIKDRNLKPRTTAGEWVSSILFAVVAATIIHAYFMQPFTIPTSSLEKTLLVGDFLFVSKFHYGARTPMTAVSVPMTHDTIPGIKKKSFLSDDRPNSTSWKDKWQYPYFRFPGFQKIKRNDIVVFNWPTDTVPYFRYTGPKTYIKPIDKKSNYVKRAVGIPGDSLEVRDGRVYINGAPNKLPGRAKLQFAYNVQTNRPVNPNLFTRRYGITDISAHNATHFTLLMTDETVKSLSETPFIEQIERREHTAGERGVNIFPHSRPYRWNVDHYGPVYIPEKGVTVAITPETIPLYKRIIEVYEGSELGIDNQITYSDRQVLLNGSPLTRYTFKQDYYWMMGDNRHNSEDARAWGFVPFSHVVGKPVFIWLSLSNSETSFFKRIRWDRMFTTVGGDKPPISWFKYFLIAVGGWIVFRFIRRKRKK